jgi:hypothetical protein
MDDDQKQRPDSLLPYERWIEHALRHVVAQAIEHVAVEGLPGGHHFYITFRTDYPGVELPQRIRAQYPKEMTIVLQHQFWDLGFNRETQALQVGLSFGGIPSKLIIPLDAVVEFADPHIRYGLRFQAADAPPAEALSLVPVLAPTNAEPKPTPDSATPGSTTAGSTTPEAPTPDTKAAEPGQVVSLDAFRRRSPQG